jgi:hypothetical protein
LRAVQDEDKRYQIAKDLADNLVAQTVVKLWLDPKLDPLFHADSYGYRPGRSAHDAIAVTKRRCWEFDWVVELDIQRLVRQYRSRSPDAGSEEALPDALGLCMWNAGLKRRCRRRRE